MFCLIVVIVEFLLFTKLGASPTENCNAIASHTCLQQCSDTSLCRCGLAYGNSNYTTCKQACDDSRCKIMTCSSGTCFQQCHNCHMECTSDVRYCSQRCLSGACSFTCNARRCVQECKGQECDHEHVTPITCRTIFPRAYLVVLAGLFAATTILSFLALILSFREMEYWDRRATYSRVQSVSSSVDSLCSLDVKAPWHWEKQSKLHLESIVQECTWRSLLWHARWQFDVWLNQKCNFDSLILSWPIVSFVTIRSFVTTMIVAWLVNSADVLERDSLSEHMKKPRELYL